jgi:signal transduction histidine kinase
VRLLQEVAVASNEADSVQEAFQFALDRLCTYLGWPLGHVYLIREDAGLAPAQLWSSGSRDSFPVFVAASEAMHYTPDEGLAGLALEAGNAIWMADLLAQERFLRRESAAESGLRTGLIMPVRAGKDPIAVMEFFHVRHEPPDDDLMALLPHIGMQIGRVIERTRMQKDLDEMKARLMESSDAERALLAREIHDGPLQDLYGAYYQIHEAAAVLSGSEEEIARRAAETIQRVNTKLRVICGELHPNTLVHLGLQRAIRGNVERLQERLEDATILLDLDDDSLPEKMLTHATRLNLYRIFQQLITNAVRHAQARHVWVRLKVEPGLVTLEVQDNGQGFTIPKQWIAMPRAGKYGLATAMERVRGMEGNLELTSHPGEGTLVVVTIPRRAED